MTDNSPDKKPANQSSQNAGASATNVEILDKLDALPKKDKEQIIATLEMYSGLFRIQLFFKGMKD